MGKYLRTVSRQIVTTGLLTFVVGWLLIGCSEIEENTVPQGKITKIPDQVLFQATVRYDNNGSPRFTVQADRIARFETTSLVEMEGDVTVDFFDAGAHTAILTSDRGTVLERKNQLSASGNVIVNSDSGMVLRTEYLFYDSDIERVLTDSFVTIITNQDSLTGYGLNATPDLKEMTIKRPSGSTWRQAERKNQ
jgi:LPS export ABC transporter protein LptC